jgi:hypothetical protein
MIGFEGSEVSGLWNAAWQRASFYTLTVLETDSSVSEEVV